MTAEVASTNLVLSTLRPGPFVSGVTHSVLSLGQRPLVGSLSDEDEDDEPYTRPRGSLNSLAGQASSSGVLANGASPKGRGPRGAKKSKAGAPTLLDLIDADVIIPGRNNISVVYKGVTYTASLNKDGMILYQGKRFSSATSFSIHCKRQQTPNKAGDDGWRSVLYEGQPLDIYRKRFQARTPAQPQPQPRSTPRRPSSAAALAEDGDQEMTEAAEDRGEGGAGAAASEATGDGAAAGGAAGHEAAEVAAAAVPETDQWVQCDRCRTWRIVPDAHWPAVEADTRDVWYCEYAMWDVLQVAPFQKACAS